MPNVRKCRGLALKTRKKCMSVVRLEIDDGHWQNQVINVSYKLYSGLELENKVIGIVYSKTDSTPFTCISAQ